MDTVTQTNLSYFTDKFLSTGIKRITSVGDIHTGFGPLDMVAPIRPEMIFIGGVCGTGKTAFAMQLADQLALDGRKVIYFATEMSPDDLIMRSLTRLQFTEGITPHKIPLSRLPFAIEDKTPDTIPLIETYKRISENLTIVKFASRPSAIDVKKYVAAYITNNKVRPIVFVDYLQMIRAKGATAKDRVDEVLSGLLELRDQFDLCMIVISSLNRASYTSPVEMTSFKESGDIEYYADLAIGMQLHIMSQLNTLTDDNGKELSQAEKIKRIKDAEASEVKEIDLVILKNRHGERCTLHSKFFGSEMRFEPVYSNFSLLRQLEREDRNGDKWEPEDYKRQTEEFLNRPEVKRFTTQYLKATEGY